MIRLDGITQPMVSDPDATIPVPKPISTPDAGMTPSQVRNLLAAGAGAFDTRPSSAGGRGWEPPSVEVLQALLPQYEITAFLARGGMGAVYQGLQRALKRPVAIKILPPEMADEEEGLQFAVRFKQEAQAMARLSHPNIVTVFDAGEVEAGTTGSGERQTLLYFVMEFIEGTDVAQLIASEGPLDAARVVPIIAAVCEALAFAHEEGIVHRDIKPSNIMIDRKGRVKVADFGLAKAVNLESTLMTRSDVAMGTPDFVAPEALIPGMQVDGRADLYAVGVMLYQMLTGKIPRGRFELPSGVVPQVDRRFDAIVDRAMQTDREKRYPTATEMKREVESVVKDGSAGTPARIFSSDGGSATKKAGKSARAPLLLAVAAVVVLGAGGGGSAEEGPGGGAEGGGAVPGRDTASVEECPGAAVDSGHGAGAAGLEGALAGRAEPLAHPNAGGADASWRAAGAPHPPARHGGTLAAGTKHGYALLHALGGSRRQSGAAGALGRSGEERQGAAHLSRAARAAGRPGV